MSGENLSDVRRRYHNSLTLCETVSCAELATRTAGNNGGVRPTLFTTLLVINMEEPPSLSLSVPFDYGAQNHFLRSSSSWP